MSIAADGPGRPELPLPWERLERAAEDAVGALATWKRRAVEAEEELVRLRRALEDLAEAQGHPADLEEEVLRLRAENAALHSRMLQARQRVAALMQRLSALGVEP